MSEPADSAIPAPGNAVQPTLQTPSGANAPAPSRLTYLDFLRFVAAAAVLAQHLFEVTYPEFFRGFLSLSPGVFGVVLFFFISGYVIPFSVRRNFSVRSFLTRRFFRIFPLYLFLLTIVVTLGAAGMAPWRAILIEGGLAGLAANTLLIQEYLGLPALISVSWTLSLEFIWYGAFLVFFLLFGWKRILTLSLLGSAGLVALSILCIVIETRLPLGRAGMLNAALLGYAAYGFHEGRLSRNSFLIAAGAFVAAALISQYVAFGVFTHEKITLISGLSGWLLATAFFLPLMLWKRARENRRINNKVTARLGEISYSIYLIHPVVIRILSPDIPPSLLLIAVVPLTVILCLLTYEAIEKPGIALGKRLSVSPSAKAVAA